MYLNEKEFEEWKKIPETYYIEYKKENPNDCEDFPEPYTLTSAIRSLPIGYYNDYEKWIYRYIEVNRILGFVDSLSGNNLTDKEMLALDFLYDTFRNSEHELVKNLGL